VAVGNPFEQGDRFVSLSATQRASAAVSSDKVVRRLERNPLSCPGVSSSHAKNPAEAGLRRWKCRFPD